MTAAAWLLDLELDGGVRRYATRAVDGYKLGALVELTVNLDGPIDEVPFEVRDTVDWWRFGLVGARVVLRWTPDGTAEQAQVVLGGFIADVEFGDPRDPRAMMATVRRGTQRDVVFPPPTLVVSEETFARNYDVEVYDDAIAGAVYPTVFGYPGSNERTDAFDLGTSPDTGWIPATPALLVKYTSNAGPGDSHVLVCAGQADAGDVRLWDLGVEVSISGVTGYVSQNAAAQVATDLLGQRYTMLEFASATDPLPVLGHRYYAAWRRSPDGGQGNVDRNLTDVALWVLRNSGRDVDLGAQEAERASLDAYAVDGFLAERVPLVSWFEANIAPLFPIQRVRSPRGEYYRHVNWWATEVDAVRHLDADSGGAVRVSAIRPSRDALANVFELRYALNLATGQYHARRVLDAEGGRLSYVPDIPGTKQGPFPVGVFIEGGIDDDLTIGSPRCAASIRRFGVIRAAPVESPFVWSDHQAALILAYRAQRDAFPRRQATYTVPSELVAGLTPGDVVTVTDSAVRLAGRPAIVRSLALGSGRTQRVTVDLLG